ncbi:hypothetical protein H4Q26_009098 [Puccinia striiformis f. sp. tritici PST-130]|nr:hypothetical protein H4Q26_009098 [Puccinia striiformis f. sp. tritici PST-130]
MLKSITAIFSESVERADAWVERLRLIGIQHRHNQQAHKNGKQVDRITDREEEGDPNPDREEILEGGVRRSQIRIKNLEDTGRRMMMMDSGV